MGPSGSPLLLPIPERLDGERVSLRPRTLADAPALWEAIEESRELLSPWLRTPGRIRSPDDAREFIIREQASWLLRERLTWGVFERENGALLGSVFLLRPDWEARVFELGYWLRKAAQGRGYMREAAMLVTRLAFEDLAANRVLARIDPRNERSRTVLRALEFVPEGTLRRDHIGPQGDLVDVQVFALLREEYEALAWAGGEDAV